ncbi:MAG: Crp/Fnr family transcriptional regulator [Woeseia sp.]|nr:Crp/Fnr family transcriptional regulator [Woeseia sp.]|tara:strand:+ start:1302 stop:2021 length:720 start_codon:yes stop_codon:yes gene_type:complete
MVSNEANHVALEVVSRSPWFQSLPKQAHIQLAVAARIRKFRKNSYLFTIGETAADVFCVVSGRIRIMITSPLGQEFALTDLGPDSWLDDPLIANDKPKMVDAQVHQAATVLTIPKSVVINIGEKYPELYKNLYKELISRTRGFYVLLTGMAFYPLKARLAGWLLNLAKQYGRQSTQGTYIDIHLSQKDLAQLSRGSRQRVNKILSEWRERKIIELKNKRYLIRDLPALTSEMELKNPEV